MHIPPKLFPTPNSKWAFWFKHTNKQQHQHRGNIPFFIKDNILWGLAPVWPYGDHILQEPGEGDMSRPYTILKRILLHLLLLLSLVQRCHHRCCNVASTNVVTTQGGSQREYHGGNDDHHCHRCHCEMMFLSGITDTYQTVGLLLSLLSSLSLWQHWHLVCFCKGGRHCYSRTSQAPHQAEGVTTIEPTVTASTSRSGTICTISRKMAKSTSQRDFFGTSGMHYMANLSTTAIDETPEDLFHDYHLTYKNVCKILLYSMLR
jgi:hypothetical protein